MGAILTGVKALSTHKRTAQYSDSFESTTWYFFSCLEHFPTSPVVILCCPPLFVFIPSTTIFCYSASNCLLFLSTIVCLCCQPLFACSVNHCLLVLSTNVLLILPIVVILLCQPLFRLLCQPLFLIILPFNALLQVCQPSFFSVDRCFLFRILVTIV